MKYREVLETVKKYASSNNILVTGRKASPAARKRSSEDKSLRLPDKKSE